jgi:hypothetical protein
MPKNMIGSIMNGGLRPEMVPMTQPWHDRAAGAKINRHLT